MGTPCVCNPSFPKFGQHLRSVVGSARRCQKHDSIQDQCVQVSSFAPESLKSGSRFMCSLSASPIAQLYSVIDSLSLMVNRVAHFRVSQASLMFVQVFFVRHMYMSCSSPGKHENQWPQ